MKTKLFLTAAVLCCGLLAAGAQAAGNHKSSHKTGVSSGCPDRAVQAQAGGTGSPVAASSPRGSTDRTPANAKGASGPSGQGTTGSGRPC